jgi:sec-independent protein translocase protein TatB
MFGISSGELFFIALIALIVLGPERLPKATRFAGLWARRARTQWNSVKDELERELAAEELKRNLQDAQTALRDTEQQIRDSGAEARREFDEMRAAVRSQDKPGAAADPDAATGTDTPVEPTEGESNEPRSA